MSRLRLAPAARKQPSAHRMVAKDLTEILEAARAVRKSLTRVVDMCEARSREVVVLSDSGEEISQKEKLTDAELKSQLYKARTWMNTAEDEFAQARGLLSRAIERAERRIA